MTEQINNVHWFGTDSTPALIFNLNLAGTSEDTFDARGSRRKARYYVDPTGSERLNGAIVAEEISHEAATEKFSRHSLSDFPN